MLFICSLMAFSWASSLLASKLSLPFVNFTLRSGIFANFSRTAFAVTGVRPDGKMFCPSRAFKNVDLPLENCPMTAMRGGSFRVSISKFRLSFISSLACRLGSFSSFTSLASSPLKSLVKTLKYLAL